MPRAALTPKQQAFVAQYLVDLNATQAAIRAGYSAKTANREGTRLLSNAVIAAAIAEAQAARAKRVEVEQDEVLRGWLHVARSDPRELIEFRRNCCRHCHGVGHGFQFTVGEKVKLGKTKLEIGDVVKDTFAGTVVFGGVGFDPRRRPVPTCTECFGEGVPQTFVHDTRDLSPEARALYAGVKETKDGLEVKMRDRDGAWVNVAKHLGMFTEKVQHDVQLGGVIRLATPMKPEDWSATAQAQQEHLEAKKRALAEAHGVG